MEEVAAIKERHEKELMALEDVVGLGVGVSSQGQPCIVAFLRRLTSELEARIPSTIEGVPVEIEEVGEFEAH